MCQHLPVHLVVLHALRICARDRAHPLDCRAWLRQHCLESTAALLFGLARLIRSSLPDDLCFAPPCHGCAWPAEEALLRAMGLACTEPQRSQAYLEFLPPSARRAAYALLNDLAAELKNCRCEHQRAARRHATQSTRH